MLLLSTKCPRPLGWWENTIWKTIWATILRTDYSIWFIGWISPNNCERPVKNPSIRKKVLPGLFLGYAVYAGRIWKGDVLVADLEELETMDASEICSKKTQCERCDLSQRRRRIIYFSNRRWTNQTPWKRWRPENIHLDMEATNSWRKSPWFSWRIRRVSSTTSRLVSRMPVKQFMIFGPCQESSYTAITLNPESSFTRRERNHSLPIPLKYIDVSRTTHTNLDVKQEKRIDDYWNIDGQETCLILGQASLDLFYWKKKPPDGFLWSGGEINKKTDYIQDRSFMARTLEDNGKECQAEGEAKVVTWKTSTR